MQGIAIGVQQKVEVGGVRATIPTDPLGKLSYYLDCIGACMPGVIESRYTDYQNSNYFNHEEIEAILILSLILTPDLLNDKVIVRITKNEMNAIKPGFTNAFITLTERTNLTYLDIGERDAVGLNLNNVQVTKTMAYTDDWLRNYYYGPIQAINDQLKRAKQVTNYQHNYSRPVQNTNYNYVAYNNSGDDDEETPYKELIICFVLVVLFNIMGICCSFSVFQKKMEKHGGALCCCVFLPGLFASYMFYHFIYTGQIMPFKS